MDPKPPRPPAGAGAPNGLAGAAAVPKTPAVKPKTPVAGAGVAPKGDVEVVRPKPEVPGAGEPKADVVEVVGGPNMFGLGPKALVVVDPNPVAVEPVPNAWVGRKAGKK